MSFHVWDRPLIIWFLGTAHKMPKKGPLRLITFEGGEGCGKSTQIAALAAHLQSLNFSVVQTREPGGTPVAEALRQVVLNGADQSFDPMGEFLIMSAARRSHCRDVIIPALAKGTWVLVDRFYDSSWVYQGFVQGLDTKWIDQLNDRVTDGLAPGLTVLLDADPAQTLERLRGRGEPTNRFDTKPLSFHQKVRQGFLERAEAINKKAPKRFEIINALGTIEEISHSIQETVHKRWGLTHG